MIRFSGWSGRGGYSIEGDIQFYEITAYFWNHMVETKTYSHFLTPFLRINPPWTRTCKNMAWRDVGNSNKSKRNFQHSSFLVNDISISVAIFSIM